MAGREQEINLFTKTGGEGPRESKCHTTFGVSLAICYYIRRHRLNKRVIHRFIPAKVHSFMQMDFAQRLP